ncbi:MAG: MCE family protein [Kofleriaceae bacterium]|nr:MCE family protein [Kofleriaceae bacterium]
MRWLSRLVQIAVIVAVIGGIVLWLRSKVPQGAIGGGFQTCAMFRDGQRLAIGSPVMIAGVRVGEISNLTIVGNFARVDIALANDAKVPIDSWITKRAYSPFGDSYLEIIPTAADEGAAPARTLRSGECISRVLEGASTDSVLRSLANAMPKLDKGLERLHEVGMYGRKWASGTLGDGVLDVEKWLDEEHIERPIERANQAITRLESATTSAAAAVHDAVPAIDRTFDRLGKGVATARTQIADVRTRLHDGLASARAGLEGTDETIADLEEVVHAIDEGKGDDYTGTLGRMINDPSTADTIEEALASAAEGTSSFSRFKSYLGLRMEYNVFSNQPRFYVAAEVRARTDKFYLVELEKGPLGGYPGDSLTNPGDVPDYTRRQSIEDKLRFTVQFGKTFGNWFQARGGIKESTFGFGADVLINQGKLRLSADLFGSFTRTPRLKLAAAMEVFRSVYFIAGIDDALNGPTYLNIEQGNTEVPIQFDDVRFGRDYFLGASLHFDDADLSMLLRVYGALLVGLL